MGTDTNKSDLAGRVRRYLRHFAQGRENAVPLWKIAKDLALAGSPHARWRAVAGAIEDLRAGVPEHDEAGRLLPQEAWKQPPVLVGTSRAKPAGAYWPMTDQDAREAVLPLRAATMRMITILRRQERLLPPAIRADVQKQIVFPAREAGDTTKMGERTRRRRLFTDDELRRTLPPALRG